MIIGQAFTRILDYPITDDRTIKQCILEDDLPRFEAWKKDLAKQKYPPSVLIQILDLMVSWSYFRERRVRAFHERLRQEKIEVDDITIELLRSDRFKKLLHDVSTPRNDVLGRVNVLLTQLSKVSLKLWLEDRHAKTDDEDDYLKEIHFGHKGINNLLRDCGFFDRAPIDVHEQRFLSRTGVHATYSKRGDPLSKSDYHEALTNFCRKELTGLKVGQYDPGSTPGLADLAIWYFCARNHGNVCASTPNCNICPIRESCLFGKSHRG